MSGRERSAASGSEASAHVLRTHPCPTKKWSTWKPSSWPRINMCVSTRRPAGRSAQRHLGMEGLWSVRLPSSLLHFLPSERGEWGALLDGDGPGPKPGPQHASPPSDHLPLQAKVHIGQGHVKRKSTRSPLIPAGCKGGISPLASVVSCCKRWQHVDLTEGCIGEGHWCDNVK